jgi:serine/threonine-protein kinase
MASRPDLELAKRLRQAGVLTDAVLREAFGLQEQLRAQGKEVGIDRVLVARGHLPKEALTALAVGDPVVSQPLSRYRLHRVLGEGGSSFVYEATYLPNGARVAVKVLDPVQSLRRDLLERFYEEARLLISLEHENVVAGYQVGTEKGLHFFSMDFIEGPTVLQMIQRAGAIEAQTALWISVQMAKALGYLHQSGLLHRDIKPGNVMIDATGRARLIDLGLVRRLDQGPREEGASDESTTVGTVEYISPEQARGRGDLDERTDVYSLGVTLYHMVVGDVPFHGETSYEVMAKHILTTLDAMKVKTRRIPPEVHYAITKMMSKEREFRYRDCPEIVVDLTRFLPEGGPPRIVLPVDTPIPPPAAAGPRSPTPPPGPKSSTLPPPRSRTSSKRRTHW